MKNRQAKRTGSLFLGKLLWKHPGLGVWLLVLLLLTGCQQSTTPQVPTFTPLVGKLTFAGSTTIQPLMAKIGDAFQQENPRVSLDIAAGGSLVGIQAIHDGTVDIGMASRALTADEAQGITQVQIATDVIAIITNPQNPVQNLSIEQLRQIYRGEIANWKDVGGPDKAIVVITREKSSGTRGAFDELVLENKESLAPNLLTAVTAGDVVSLVSQEPLAIGYVGFGNLGSDVKAVAVEGVIPSSETALSGQYPLTRPLLLLTGPLSQKLATRFIEFVLSPEGQVLVAESGWVPVEE